MLQQNIKIFGFGADNKMLAVVGGQVTTEDVCGIIKDPLNSLKSNLDKDFNLSSKLTRALVLLNKPTQVKVEISE
jgi:hypothetical protein